MKHNVFTGFLALAGLVALGTGALAQDPHAGHHPAPTAKTTKAAKKPTGCGCCDKCKMMQGGKGMKGMGMHGGMGMMGGKGMMGAKP